MKKKQLMILVPAVLILAVGIRAVTKGEDPRKQSYSFMVNDYKMVRSTKRSQRRYEKAYILEKLLNNPQEFNQFPLAQHKGKTFIDSTGQHMQPAAQEDIVARADIIHSKGSVKDFYKLKKSPWLLGGSRVVCLPRSRARQVPEGNFRYKFTTKAQKTKYGTMYYSCYVDAGSEKIKELFENLPGKKVRGIKTIGAQ